MYAAVAAPASVSGWLMSRPLCQGWVPVVGSETQIFLARRHAHHLHVDKLFLGIIQGQTRHHHAPITRLTHTHGHTYIHTSTHTPTCDSCGYWVTIIHILYINKLPCLSVFQISQKREDRFPWNFSWFIGVTGRRAWIKTSGKFRPLMRKNWENGAKWPILRKSTRATSAGLCNGLRSQFAHTPAHWPTSVRANRALAWGRGP